MSNKKYAIIDQTKKVFSVIMADREAMVPILIPHENGFKPSMKDFRQITDEEIIKSSLHTILQDKDLVFSNHAKLLETGSPDHYESPDGQQFPTSTENFINPEDYRNYSPPEKLRDFSQNVENYSLLECGEGITNNEPLEDYFYNEDLNAFISPKPDPTYVLNNQSFEWEPDQQLEYNLHGDGVMYKWNGSGWMLAS